MLQPAAIRPRSEQALMAAKQNLPAGARQRAMQTNALHISYALQHARGPIRPSPV